MLTLIKIENAVLLRTRIVFKRELIVNKTPK